MKKPWYVILKYVDTLENAAGKANGPVVRIDKDYKRDVGLHLHEYEHVKQWYKALTLPHSLLYLFVPRYRYWCELQAYRIQCKHGLSYEKAAAFIVEGYGLNMKYDRVLYDLKFKG